jgi:hypothetical protein
MLIAAIYPSNSENYASNSKRRSRNAAIVNSQGRKPLDR